MIPRSSALAQRGIRTFHPVSQITLHARRWNSSASQPSPSSTFYKTFTRPVAKCLLLAVLTYQLVYLGWVKLESNEIKGERKSEISELEAQVKSLQESVEKKR